MSVDGLKIALVNTFYPPFNFGGDGVYVRRFAHALARRGCDVHVIHDTETYKTLAPKPLGDLTPLSEPEGVTVHRLESGLGVFSSLMTHQTGRPVANGKRLKAILGDSFDVTHFHNVSMVGGPGILSMGSGVSLYTAHDHWLVCPTHILWRYNRELCDRRECVKCQISHRRPPQLWRSTGFLDRQAGHIDAFIALSQASADNHRRFGFKPEMRVLPTFLPDESQTEAAAPAQSFSRKPYALFVGRLEIIKGLQDLIPLFRDNPPADLVIVGDGEYGRVLRELARGSPTIHFLGRMPPERLTALYANCVAALLPSVCYEVFPLVALEAFRAGAPIVARELGPFPEIIERSNGGLVFKTPAEASAAIARLAADPDLRRRLGAAGRAAFKTDWSEKAALGAYFDLIAEKAAAKGLTKTFEKARRMASA